MQAGLLMPLPQGAQQAQQQPQNAQQGQAPGQQPILNDALSYLDQVKVQFAEHPDVYNRFLDIMKDFKGGVIDTPGVIGRVSSLFAGNPELIQGFNTFLPPGYRIECGPGNDTSTIRVTTPMGSSIHPMPIPTRPHPDEGIPIDGLRPPNGTSTPQPGQLGSRALSPGGRPGAHPSSVEATRRQEQQQVMHQQEQRGVSSLQNAVSAATGGATLRAGVSPRGTPLPGQQDPMAIIDGHPGQPLLEKRGPVEFNHAISYVNKIKVSEMTYLGMTYHVIPARPFFDLFTTSLLIRTIADLNSIESFLFTARRLQAIPRNLANISARIEAHPRRVQPSYRTLQRRTRSTRRFQAIPSRVCRTGKSCRARSPSSRRGSHVLQHPW